MCALRIGINALYLIPGGVGGTEIFLRNLLAALSRIDDVNKYFVIANRESSTSLAPPAGNFKILTQPIYAESRVARICWEQAAIPALASRLHLDVLLNAGNTAPLLCGCPQVTVFHDLQFKHHPEHFRRREIPVYRALHHLSARASSEILADSDATADDLRRFYPRHASKVSVVHLGAEREFESIFQRRAPEHFLLTPSAQHPHKNLENLLRAFADFHSKHPSFRLVVCGMHGLATDRINSVREALGLADIVQFPGWLPRDEVYDLYSRAWACVLPSKFEGFGLPLVEAMACGLPTACSAIEPLTTIAAGAAIHFDPDSIGSIVAAMTRIVNDGDLRLRLSEAGRERSKAFSWEACAAATLRALVRAAASRTFVDAS